MWEFASAFAAWMTETDWQELNAASIILRILLSIGVGGVIGLERGIKNQPAGFRTYMLVCLGASLVMMTNQYICDTFGGGDPSRLGAQVISGIGFLGAGTILVTNGSRIRGLTTAAGLWTAACVGLAIGVGFYQGAIAAGMTIWMIMTFFQRVDHRLRARSRYIRLCIRFASGDGVNRFLNQCGQMNLKVTDMQMAREKGGGKGAVTVVCTAESRERCRHMDVIGQLSQVEGLRHIEEM